MITYMLLSRRARRSGIDRCRRTKPVYELAARTQRAGRRALNVQAAAKVATALERIADGNLSNVKGVGGGVLECRVDFGLGYRIYFGRDGGQLVILLAGGTKKRQ